MFSISAAGDRVWAQWTEDDRVRSVSDLTSLLVGPILGGLLRMRGTISLHGCVIEMGSRSVVLLGTSGMGKSTIATAMAQRGHAVLSDDVAVLTERGRGRWLAQAGYPRLRLDPAAIGALDAPVTEAGPVLRGFAKRYIELLPGDGVGPWRFQRNPRPVQAVYALERDPGLAAPVVEPLRGAARLTAFTHHARAALAPLESPARAREFARFGRLAASVSVNRLRIPDDLAAVPAVCDAIDADAPWAGERSP